MWVVFFQCNDLYLFGFVARFLLKRLVKRRTSWGRCGVEGWTELSRMEGKTQSLCLRWSNRARVPYRYSRPHAEMLRVQVCFMQKWYPCSCVEDLSVLRVKWIRFLVSDLTRFVYFSRWWTTGSSRINRTETWPCWTSSTSSSTAPAVKVNTTHSPGRGQAGSLFCLLIRDEALNLFTFPVKVL